MEWISVKDRLPLEGQEVLVLNSKGVNLAEYWPEKNEWTDSNYGCCGNEHLGKVTHWMPLPKQPPKE